MPYSTIMNFPLIQTLSKQDSFNISNTVDGSALYYNVNFIDSNSVVCNSSNVSAPSCSQRTCILSPVQLTSCSHTGNINVTMSAVNLIGQGPDTSISVGKKLMH